MNRSTHLVLLLAGVLPLLVPAAAIADGLDFPNVGCSIRLADGWNFDERLVPGNGQTPVARLAAEDFTENRNLTFYVYAMDRVVTLADSGLIDHLDVNIMRSYTMTGDLSMGFDTVNGVRCRWYAFRNEKEGFYIHSVEFFSGGFQYCLDLRKRDGPPKDDPTMMAILHSFTLTGVSGGKHVSSGATWQVGTRTEAPKLGTGTSVAILLGGVTSVIVLVSVARRRRKPRRSGVVHIRRRPTSSSDI
jgi:hypothetical protein